MADILEFTGATKCDLPPDKLLSAALGKMERVVIIGIDKDGNEYLSSSVADCAVIVWDLERAKYKLLTVPDMDDI